jgi:hypothetical protein
VNIRKVSLILLVLITSFLVSCNRTESDWKQAKDANTLPAYMNFIAKHPSGPHVDEAKEATENLEWAAVARSGTADDFFDFYNRHPTTSRLRKITGDIVSSPSIIGMVLTNYSATVSDAAALVVSIEVGGQTIDVQPTAEEAGRLGLIQYQRHGETVDAARKTLKNSTLLILPETFGGKARIVAVKTAGH